MTPKEKKPKQKQKTCTCVEKVNKQLEQKNAAIATDIMFDFENSRATTSPPQVMLRKRDSQLRKPLPSLYASYCPFCGKKYDIN